MPVIDIGPDPNRFYALLALRPELSRAWKRLESEMHGDSSTLPNSLKEHARRALSAHVGCRFCNSFGVVDRAGVSRGEELVLDLAEKIATDHRTIDQGTFDALKEEFTDEQIVELTMWLCFKLGANVLGAITQLEPASEEALRRYETSGEMMVETGVRRAAAAVES